MATMSAQLIFNFIICVSIALVSSQDDSCARCVEQSRVRFECPEAMRRLKEQGIYPDVCKFSGRTTTLCCYPKRRPETRKPSRPTFAAKIKSDSCARCVPTSRVEAECPEVARRIREHGIYPKVCQRFGREATLCCYPSGTKYKCGETELHSFRGRVSARFDLIYGGVDAEVKEFPWAVRIGHRSNKGTEWFCGGTLVSPTHVISAAHCFTEFPRNARLVVRVGEYDVRTNTESQHVDIPISRVTTHPRFRGLPYDDIAVVKLRWPVTYNEYVNSACLPSVDLVLNSGQIGIAIGWGHTDPRKRVDADILQKVNLFVNDQKSCDAQFRSAVPTFYGTKLPEGVTPSILCAGTEIPGFDACQGDSGGGYFIQYPNTAHYILVGVISAGFGCGSGLPGIYTNVQEYLPWINKVMNN